MKIAVASDHAGFTYKEIIKTTLIEQNYEVKDFGTRSTEAVDYPDFILNILIFLKSKLCFPLSLY